MCDSFSLNVQRQIQTSDRTGLSSFRSGNRGLKGDRLQENLRIYRPERTLMGRQVPLGAAIATVLALLLSAPGGASAQIAVSANDNKVLLATESARFPETLSRKPSR